MKKVFLLFTALSVLSISSTIVSSAVTDTEVATSGNAQITQAAQALATPEAFASTVRVSNFEDLKYWMEDARYSLNIVLTGDQYLFTDTISTNKNIKLKLISESKAELVMDPSMSIETPFFNTPNATLVFENIEVTKPANNFKDLQYCIQNVELPQLPLNIIVHDSQIEFEEEILTEEPVMIRIHGNAKSEFTMERYVPENARFINMPQGSLDVYDLRVTGHATKNGGLNADKILVNNCIFTNNKNREGGALGSWGSTRIEAVDSEFDGNLSDYDGGAIRMESYQKANRELIVTNCKFTNNDRVDFSYGRQYGGAISAKGLERVTIEGCTFENNTTAGANPDIGGAVTILGTLHVKISNSTFKDNTSEEYGGAIGIIDCGHRNSGMGIYGLIENCTFIDNSAAHGGAIWIDNQGGQVLNIKDCTFSNNQASEADYGGAVYSYYGIYTRVHISGCNFETANDTVKRAADGGYFDGTYPQ